MSDAPLLFHSFLSDDIFPLLANGPEGLPRLRMVHAMTFSVKARTQVLNRPPGPRVMTL